MEAQLTQLIYRVLEQLKDIEINSNDVVEIELNSMEVEKLNLEVEEKEEPQTQKENEYESKKENVEGNHFEVFSSYFLGMRLMI